MADGSGKVICAICYEEAKPACEELQSISLCGHVFHELCLQQWLEYCPRGKKCTCPLCKQQCSDKDVHRLYFQSAAEARQTVQESCSQLPCNSDTVETLQVTVQKLTGQLLAAKTSLEAHQEQLQEANKQLSLCITRAEKAESSYAEVSKEKSSLKDAVSRLQEELKRSTGERCKLLERNTLLTKELASYNLLQCSDINEDEVARMARVGCGNKDDAIITLTRSLILRNRAYKDLMVKCNGLGTGENRALRKCEKAFERIKVLKARVQKLERCLEDKENGELRFLKGSSGLCHNDAESPVLSSKKSQVASKPPLPLQPSSQAKQISDPSSEPVKILNSSNVIAKDCCLPEEKIIQISHPSKDNRIAFEQITTKDDRTDIRSSFHEGDVGGLSKHSDAERKSRDYGFTSAPAHCNKLDKAAVITDDDLCSDELGRSPFPVTIRRELRLSASTLSETSRMIFVLSATSIWDNQMPNPSKWSKPSLARGESSSVGTFISVGANGRGGQVKVLRPPPMLKVGGTSSGNCLRSTKKMKSSRSVQAGSQHRSLQIEHFFSNS